ncbi:hypothetical protein ACFW04_011543 [Cataglyphis niger]
MEDVMLELDLVVGTPVDVSAFSANFHPSWRAVLHTNWRASLERGALAGTSVNAPVDITDGAPPKENYTSIVNRHAPLFLHDNARPHTSHRTIAKLNELKYEVLQHPAYSSDLSPTDFHFFKHLDLFLRAKQYENEESLKNSISEFIDSKDQNFFKTGIYALKSRWEKCIEANGAYFD